MPGRCLGAVARGVCPPWQPLWALCEVSLRENQLCSAECTAQPLFLLPLSDPFKLLPQGLSQVFPVPLIIFLGHPEVLQFLPHLGLSSVCGFQSSFSLCPELLAFCSTALNTNWILCWLSLGLLTLHPDKCWLWQHPGFRVRISEIYIRSPQHGHIFSQPLPCVSPRRIKQEASH